MQEASHATMWVRWGKAPASAPSPDDSRPLADDLAAAVRAANQTNRAAGGGTARRYRLRCD
jgi:hypothetical protein